MLVTVPSTYPNATRSRTITDLSGMWKIAFDFDDKGESAFSRRIPPSALTVAVPASYNDQFVDAKIRDFVGAAWYYREVFIPQDDGRNHYLRFGSVNYHAAVYLNGTLLGRHSGGHLPFTVAIPPKLCGTKALLTVMADNRLTWQTIPPGHPYDLTKKKNGIDKKRHGMYFDFFHYAGINRRVLMLSVPRTFVQDMTVTTVRLGPGKRATLAYSIEVSGKVHKIGLRLIAPDGSTAFERPEAARAGEIIVDKPLLWEIGKGNLYTFSVEVTGADGVIDECIERIGIRTVAVKGTKFLLNGKPVYFQGFGRHEDFFITGRNLPDAVLVRDFELLRWTGANSFRTSHYPYSEEHMTLADELGIMVIDETPAVGMRMYGNDQIFREDRVNEATRIEHERILGALIQRDKNRACVVMWSVANEAATTEKASRPYFKRLAQAARRFDPTRPITNVICLAWDEEQTADLFDVVCVNRYVAWYVEPGDLGVIDKMMGGDLDNFHRRFKKPILLAEFGADTVAGLHSLPATMFSEEFQTEFIKAYCKVLDKKDYVIGEHVWNFADFMTCQSINRVMGNRKGVFTRDRQPKAAAFFLRERWQGRAAPGFSPLSVI